MAKRKTPKELMADRNPLARQAVAPLDIYNQPPQPPAEQPATLTEEQKEKARADYKAREKKRGAKVVKPAPKPKQKENEEVGPYSTYLTKSQVKGIKLRAVEREVKDMNIVQEAVDEYFKNHPL